MGNAQIKLLFPGHDLPFVVPYQNSSELRTKIDKILLDLGASTRLEQGGWILVDVAGAELLHSTCLSRVAAGRTYMVIDTKDAGAARERVRKMAPPPGYEDAA